ncbi:MAG: polysaccharide deacetylase family protein [Bdellovibrionaceae bacterium]|nr:polysaccharide deacetylase family protein [Pseudobdellovibrionaceae bacterium]
MKTSQIVLSMIALGVMAGCSGGNSNKDVAASLKANKDAKNIAEYELSGKTAEDVFAKWKLEGLDAKAVCEALSAISAAELTHFEEEIQNEENASLIAPCKGELEAKLEQYWQEQRKDLKVKATELPEEGSEARLNGLTQNKEGADEIMDINSGFSFPDGSVTRNFKGGYKVVSGDLANKQVVLTFDDGPHQQHTASILNTLGAVNAKAIFFSLGKAAKANPEMLRRVGSRGHAVGSHSWSHKCLPFKKICQSNNGRMLSFAEAKEEIVSAHRTIEKILGWVDPFFRFPYGESSAELSMFLKERDVGEFFWSIDSNDWRSSNTPSSIIRNVMSDLNARGRGVLLFHDIHRRTAEALPTLLRELYFNGYQVVLMKSSDPNARTQSRLLQ